MYYFTIDKYFHLAIPTVYYFIYIVRISKCAYRPSAIRSMKLTLDCSTMMHFNCYLRSSVFKDSSWHLVYYFNFNRIHLKLLLWRLCLIIEISNCHTYLKLDFYCHHLLCSHRQHNGDSNSIYSYIALTTLQTHLFPTLSPNWFNRILAVREYSFIINMTIPVPLIPCLFIVSN